MNIPGILRNARLISWSYRIISTAVGLITIRLISERIGVDGYGHVAYVLAILTGISAIDLGFHQALPRFVARYDDSNHRVRRPYFWAVCALACVAILLLQVGLIIGLTAAFGFMGQLQALGLGVLVELSFVMILGNILTAGSAVFAGFQYYGTAGIAKIGRSIAYLLCVVWLWATGELTLQSVLWSNALTLFFANGLVTIWMFVRFRNQLTWTWYGFPRAHQVELKDMAVYSLHGWLFTLSTVLIANGSIIATGLILLPENVAKLQVALVLLTGVSAFVTGSMTPLTTIVARNSDDSATSRARVGVATSNLIEEAIIFSAVLVVFFFHYGQAIVSLLLGVQSGDRNFLIDIQWVLIAAVLPSLAVLPFFTFRFALVSKEQNALYSRRVLSGTLLALVLGIAGAAMSDSLVMIAIGVGTALLWRGLLAFHMGRHVLPGISFKRILIPMGIALVISELFAVVTKLINFSAISPRLSDVHVQAILYGMACVSLYIFRARLSPLLSLRLEKRATDDI